ncbi:MAG: polymer-forming cytoskeletal protein [Caldiserica bacterium]|nr:polymer-forming cytoskeletal protein [Caldisericota bacterium]
MNKKGIIGILSLFLMLVLVLFGAAIALITRAHYKNMVDKADGVKSLYLAEAGVERAIWKLNNDSSSQDTGILYSNEPLGDGYYTVETFLDGVDTDTRITILSTGFLKGGRGKKRVRKKILIRNLGSMGSFTKYALFWGNTDGVGTVNINNSVDITRLGSASGDVFANGDISINHASRIAPGLVYSTGTVSGGGVYTPGGVPNPVPQFPTLDTSYYDSKLTIAGTQPPGDWSLKGSTYNLNGSTLYVNGNVTIWTMAELIGPGSIVATGNITLRNSSDISNVELIAGGTLRVENAVNVGGDNLLYSSTNIVIRNAASITGNILSPGNITIENSAEVRGIVYSGGTTQLRNSARIQGSIISDEFSGGTITNAVHIIHDNAYIPSSPLPGLGGGSTTEVISLGFEELPLD